MSDFDIAGAKQAGYSDTEIADHLAKTRNFDAPAARKAGYSDTDILGHLAAPPSAQPKRLDAAMSANVPSGLPPASQAPPEMGWGDVAVSAVKHLPESAGNFLHAMVQPVLHPVDTAHNMLAVTRGLEAPMQNVKVTLPNGQTVMQPQPVPETPEETTARTAPANAVGKFYGDRYGTMKGFKNALATDPVGVAGDAATVLTGGGGAAVRAPGVVGKLGEIAQTAGKLVDPLTLGGNALKATGKVGEGITSNVLGVTTGAGTDAIRTAANAGREGGDVGKAFRENIRGDVPIADIVDRAKAAVGEMRQERSAAYKTGMGKVGNDKTVLDFQPIEDALFKSHDVGTYKGQIVNRSAGAIMDKITDLIGEWQGLNPKEFHTPEGLDALKRTIGDLRDSTDFGTPARLAADRVYNAVKGEILKQAPEYASVMEAYQKASDKLKETTKTFSLGERATGDTASRKLQSALRNNVNTNFGERHALLDELAAHDPTLPAAIAGQSLNSLAPRGLIGRGGMLAAGGTIASNPLHALTLPAFLPRVVGEGAYLAGRGRGIVETGLNALHLTPDMIRRLEQAGFQGGRVNALAGAQ